MTTEPETFRPYPIDWRFLPESGLAIKDWLRAGWINAVDIEERTPRVQRLWGATLARHWVKPVLRAQLLFVHLPRTAGTSLCSQLYGRNLPHLTANTWKGVLGSAGNEIQSFSIVREPTERLISLYAFLKQGGTQLMAAPRYDPWMLSSANDFGEFLARLWDSNLRCSKPVYLRLQSDCLSDGDGSIAVDRLFSFSEANGLPDVLFGWLGLPPIPYLNASRPVDIGISASLRSRIEQHCAADFEIYQRIEDSGGMLHCPRSGLAQLSTAGRAPAICTSNDFG